MAGYERIYWEDEPSTNTPISAENLNKMDLGIANCAAEGAEHTTQIETIDARIDEIIALPDGSTTADAELIDIRVGAGGNTFNSAGTAVRTQIKKLASVSDTQPSDPSNRIWIKGDAEEVEIPTMEELNEVKADLLQIEDDIGISSNVYTIPDTYKSANYSNQAGTLVFKYEQDKIILKKVSATSAVSASEVNTTNANLTIDDEIGYGISDSDNPFLRIEYSNDCASEVMWIIGRFYNSAYSNYSNARIDVPAGTGELDVDLVDLADSKDIDLSARPNFVIRGLAWSSHNASQTEETVVNIIGYYKNKARLIDRITTVESDVTSIEGSMANIGEQITEMSASIDELDNLGQNIREDITNINIEIYNNYTENLFEEKSDTMHLSISSTAFEQIDYVYGFYVKVDPTINTAVKIQRENVGARFRAVATTDVPAVGVTYDSAKRAYNDTGKTISYSLDSSDRYLYIYYYSSNSDTITEEQALAGFKIFYGDTYIEKISRISTLEETVGDLVSDVEELVDISDDVVNIKENLRLDRTYTIPSGYRSANYSNAAGTLVFKYDNDKLALKVATGRTNEVNTGNAGLSIDSTLGYTVGDFAALCFEYSNENPENAARLLTRFYRDNWTQNISLSIVVPVGTGIVSINLLQLAKDSEIDVSLHKNFMIRGLSILSGTENPGLVDVKIHGITATPTLEDELNQVKAEVDNITDTIEDTLHVGTNLYEKRYEDLGYPNSSGTLDLYSAEYIEMTSDYIDVEEGDAIAVQMWVKGVPKGRLAYFNQSKEFLSYDNIPVEFAVVKDGIYYLKYSKIIESNVQYLRVGYGSYGDGKIMVTKNSIISGWQPAPIDVGSRVYNAADSYSLRGFAHCGKKELAPENTALSFMLAAQQGYTMVETDVRFTSDNIPVLLHDATINRTARNADGTALSSDVYIHEITYAQAYEYDFGIWKGASFAGTKIMKFEDFIILCKRLNLYPAIEIKNDENHITEAQVHIMIDIVRGHQMIHRCHFQSYQLKALTWVKKYEPEAWLGMSASSSVDSPISEKRCIELKYFLKTPFNDVFISAKDEVPENIALIKQYGIQLYTFAEESEYLSRDPLVVGVISDDSPYPEYVRTHILDSITSE